MKKIRRLWWNWSDDIGAALWMIVIFMVSVMAWLCYGLKAR